MLNAQTIAVTGASGCEKTEHLPMTRKVSQQHASTDNQDKLVLQIKKKLQQKNCKKKKQEIYATQKNTVSHTPPRLVSFPDQCSMLTQFKHTRENKNRDSVNEENSNQTSQSNYKVR